jgi:patatin-related protein
MAVDTTPEEEIRFAVILNGGVSLAVWMGGATLEINRVTKADGSYGYLLNLIRSSARADVISGTSAGGINGAALALAQVNEVADLSILRDLWADQGRMESLLRRPFRGGAPSLLQGDEFFLPQLGEAFRRLITPYYPTAECEHPIDLTITTTLLRGAPLKTLDDLGQTLYQTVHEGRFCFRRDPDAATPLGTQPSTDFCEENIAETVRRLALAARCTAGFPVAFEPSFVPATRSGTGGDGDLRPDMGAVASWIRAGDADQPADDRSRFTVDGGVLVNTPTRAALEAVDRMPADGPVRRIMFLLHPHAMRGVVDRPDGPNDMPPLTQSTVGLVAAMSSQAGRSFVEQVDERNRAAGARRATRSELLARFADKAPKDTAWNLHRTAEQLLPYYLSLRMKKAARDLANRVPPNDQWHFERIRRAAEAAQREWASTQRRPGEGTVPYVPSALPPAGVRALSNGEAWPWGITTVEHLLSSALDLLKRLVWVLPTGASCDDVKQRRAQLHKLRASVRQLRDAVDRPWLEESELSRLVPNQDYWRLRLVTYRYAMFSDAPSLKISDGFTPTEVDRLHEWLGPPGAIGSLVCAAAIEVAKIVAGVVPHLASSRPYPALDERKLDLAELQPWKALLTADPTWREKCLCATERVLGRLLNLCVVTTCLGEETDTASEQTVELTQISLQAENPFAGYSRAPDDKAAGMALSRFSGFLKQSWRINDWIWGRMDAATILCRVLLDPYRLRRIAELDGTIDDDPRTHAVTTVRGLVRALLGVELERELLDGRGTADARMRRACELAVEELTCVYDRDVPVDNLPRILPGLAGLAAWGVQWRIAIEELPILAAAIRADRIEGANRMSRGETFLETQGSLLLRLARLPRDAPQVDATCPSSERVRTGLEALTAFDRAGIGGEELAEERTSDQMIRTAATAAGVALTVMDAPQSGFSAVRPVTRALRGAALLPYWIVLGLTRGGSLAKFLALLALAVGGMLTALAVLAPLPDWAAGPAAAVGAGALLTAFGYAALRTGTLLHGVVLLTPVIPLGVYAWVRGRNNLTHGIAVLLAVGLLAAGLVALGSLPAPMRSPIVVLRRGLSSLVRQAPLLLLFPALAGGAVSVGRWMARWLPTVPWQTVPWRAAVVCVVVGTTALGWVMAWKGRQLRLWQQAADARDPQDDQRRRATWEPDIVAHPSGTTAQWSVVYGAIYLLVGSVLLLVPGPRFLTNMWVQVAIFVSVAFAVVLLLVIPWLAPRLARRRLKADIAAEVLLDAPSRDPEGLDAAVLEHLKTRHRTYAFLVRPKDDDLALTFGGRWLRRRISQRLAQLKRQDRRRSLRHSD